MTDFVVKEWKDLPEDIDDLSDPSSAWTWGRGGQGYPGGEGWHLTHIDEEGGETCYPVPSYLNYIIDTVRVWGRQDAQREMRTAMGAK